MGRGRGGRDSGSAVALVRLLPAFAFLLLAPVASVPRASLAAPQQKPGEGREERERVDPYTEGDAEALEEAGYVRFGPFLWAEEHTTEVAEEAMGGVPLLWVETEHFKLGCALDTYDYQQDHRERKKVRDELKRLKKRMRSVKSKPRNLDPWLRVHLWAQRLEELYASFCESFGLEPTSASPVEAGAEPRTGSGGGAYLGMRDKFCVLLVEKQGTLARYTARFCDRPVDTTYRFHFPKTDTLFFGLAVDSLTGACHNDSAMHYAVAYNLAQNLSNAYLGYTHEAPVWWNVGLARWFARRADARWVLYSASRTAAVRLDEKEAEWGRRVRARVEQDFYPTMADLLEIGSFVEMDQPAHLMVWSRVDHLMSLDTGIKRELLAALASSETWQAMYEGRHASHSAKLIQEALGTDLDTLDRDWVEWVVREYPRK